MARLRGTGLLTRHALARWSYAVGVLPAVQRARATCLADVRIFAYHRVLDVPDDNGFKFDLALVSASVQQFREQMVLLRRKFQPIRFQDLIAALHGGPALPRHAVIVSFDDGYDDNYRLAFPVLRELDVPAMFFVATGHIDSGAPYAYDWLVHMVCVTAAERLVIAQLGIDCALPAGIEARRVLAATLLDRIKRCDDALQSAVISQLQLEWDMPRTPHPDCRPMSWEQLREMEAAGMEIGSHGVHHRMLAKLLPAQMENEVACSKAALDSNLDKPASVLAYPVGGSDAYDQLTIDAAKRAGYSAACSYIPGTNALADIAPYKLRRLAVEREMDIAWFDAMATLPELFAYPARKHAD